MNIEDKLNFGSSNEDTIENSTFVSENNVNFFSSPNDTVIHNKTIKLPKVESSSKNHYEIRNRSSHHHNKENKTTSLNSGKNEKANPPTSETSSTNRETCKPVDHHSTLYTHYDIYNYPYSCQSSYPVIPPLSDQYTYNNYSPPNSFTDVAPPLKSRNKTFPGLIEREQMAKYINWGIMIGLMGIVIFIGLFVIVYSHTQSRDVYKHTVSNIDHESSVVVSKKFGTNDHGSQIANCSWTFDLDKDWKYYNLYTCTHLSEKNLIMFIDVLNFDDIKDKDVVKLNILSDSQFHNFANNKPYESIYEGKLKEAKIEKLIVPDEQSSVYYIIIDKPKNNIPVNVKLDIKSI